MAKGTTIASAYIQIMPSTEGIKGKITEALGGESESAGKASGESIGHNLVGKLKAVIAAAGIGKFISSSLSEGADLQQSIGGIETLFKDSADTMKAYAAEAYKTAGVSANDYMEQATSFAASLISGLGGDTKAAAELANTAIIDMADNANKMGTDMESIQYAYQGFAKQNYTMLDNLKLGYGGTQSEMIRLINDSGILQGKIEDLDNVSFDQIIQAIHKIQENMGITGTTAAEAAETYSGSLASMKAAWSDLLGNLTLGEDIRPSLKSLNDTVSTFISGNMLPMVGNLLRNVPTMLKGMGNTVFSVLSSELGSINFSELGTKISSAFSSIAQGDGLTQAVKSGMGLVRGLVSGVTSMIPQIVPTAMQALMNFSGTLRQNAGYIVDEGLNLIMNLAQSLIDNIPVFIQTVPTIVTNIAGIINDNAPKILTAGLQLIVNLGKGLISAVPTLLQNIPQILEAIVSAFTAFNWVNLGKTIIQAIGNGIKTLAKNIPTAIKNIGQTAINWFKGMSWRTLGSNIINLIVSGIKSLLMVIPNALKSIGSAAVTAFKNINWLDLGKNILKGILAGIQGSLGALLDGVKGVCSDLLGSVKEFFGINSPSTVMAEQGGYLVDGIINGMQPLKERMAGVLEGAGQSVQTFGGEISSSAVTAGNNYLTGFISSVQQLPGQAWTWFSDTVSRAGTFLTNMRVKATDTGSSYLTNLTNYAKQLPGQVWTQFSDTISRAVTFASNFKTKATEAGQGFFSNIKSALSGLPSEMQSIGSNIVNGIWNGISSGWSWLKNKVSSLAHSLLDAAKDALGINSPSKAFRDEVGQWIPAGIATGIEGNASSVRKAIRELSRDAVASWGNMTVGVSRSSQSLRAAGREGSAGGGFVQNVSIYSPKELSPYEVARQTRNATKNMVLSMRRA